MSTVSFFDAEFQATQALGVGLEGHQLIYTIGSRTEAVECCIVIDKGLVTGVQSGDILVSVNGVSLINNNAFPDGRVLQCCRQLLMENVHSTRNVRFLRVHRKLGPDQDVFDSTVVTLSPGEASLIFDEVKRIEHERRMREKSKVLLAQREKQQQQQNMLMGKNMGRNGSSNNNNHNNHMQINNNHTYSQELIPALSSTPTSSAAKAAYSKPVTDPRIENEVQQRVARESLRMDEELKRVKQEADAMKAQVESMKRAALLAMAADEEEEHAYKSIQGMYREDLTEGMEIPQRGRSPSTSVALPGTGYSPHALLSAMQGHNAGITTTSSLLSSADVMDWPAEKSQREKGQQRELERELRERDERERHQRERSVSYSSTPFDISGMGYGFTAGGGGGMPVAGGGNATAAMIAMEQAERDRKYSRDRAISISSAQSDSSGRGDAAAAAAAMIAMEKAAVRAMEEEAARLAEQTRLAHLKREQLLEQQRRLEMVDSELTRARRDTTDEYADHHGQRDRNNRDREHLRDRDEFEREEAARERQEMVQRAKREALRLLRDEEERNELRQRELEEQQENSNYNNSNYNNSNYSSNSNSSRDRDARERIGRDQRSEYDDERELRDNRERERERERDRERDRQYPRNRALSTSSAQSDSSSSREHHRDRRDRERDRMPLPPPPTNTATTGSNQRRNDGSNSASATSPHPTTSPLSARGTAALTFADHNEEDDENHNNHVHASRPRQQQQQQQQSPPVNRQPSLSPSARMDLPRPLAPPPSSNYNPQIESPSQSGRMGSSGVDPSTEPSDGPEVITGPHVFQISYGPPGPIGVTLHPFTLTTTHDDQLLSFYAAIVTESRGSPSIQRGDVIVSVNGAPLIAETSQVPRRSRDGAPDGEKHVEVVKNMIVGATAPNRPRVFRFFRCATIDASQPIVHLSEEEAMILLEGYQRP